MACFDIITCLTWKNLYQLWQFARWKTIKYKFGGYISLWQQMNNVLDCVLIHQQASPLPHLPHYMSLTERWNKQGCKTKMGLHVHAHTHTVHVRAGYWNLMIGALTLKAWPWMFIVASLEPFAGVYTCCFLFAVVVARHIHSLSVG